MSPAEVQRRLHSESLTLGYGGHVVLEELSLDIPWGKVTALIGPNGCGKSTLLRALARLLKPFAGAAFLDGTAIHTLPTREVAKRMSILPQQPNAPEGLSVEELVSYGRFPFRRGLAGLSQEDRAIIDEALRLTGMTGLRARPIGGLSGGQRQRAWISMALAQATPLLLLDEPTTFLDMAHQLEVLQLMERLNATEGKTVVMVLHDLNHAARFADHLVAIKAGQVVAAGSPETLMTPELIREVFGVDAEVVKDPRTGRPLCVPFGVVAKETS